MKLLIKILCIQIIAFTFMYSNQDREKISLQLQWKHQFQFAGYYIAKEKGFYKELGLDIEIKEFQRGLNVTNEVLEGKSQYGIGRSTLLIDKSKNKDIVLLSSILKTSPLVLFSLKSSNINSIKDFKNKKIMINKEETGTIALKAMLSSQDVHFDDFEIFKRTYNIQDLLSKKIDIMPGYISDKGYVLDKLNVKYNVFNPKDYGFEFYEDILFTSSDELINNPQRVEKFRKASLKGWEYAFSNIEETVDLILKKYNSQNKSKESYLYEAKVLKNLAYSDTGDLGSIDKNKILKIYDVYHLLGIIKEKISLNNFIYQEPKTNNINFSKDEQKYLNKKKQITMCIDPDWMPYEKNDKGKHIGMASDYIQLLQKSINVPIMLVNTQTWNKTLTFSKERKCDIVSLLMTTQERKSFLDFTKFYLRVPLVLVTNMEEPFISDITKIKKEIGIVKGYAYKDILQSKYPNIKFKEVNNLKDGLTLVSKKKLFGFIETLATTGYYIQKDYFGEIKIATKIDEILELGIGTRNDEPHLKNIFNKAIDTISEQQKQEILNKWISVNYEQKTDYTIIIKWIIGIIFIFSIIIYIILRANKKLSSEIKKRKKTEKKLKKYINLVDEYVITSSTDLKGQITYVSQAFCQISGYSKDELLGKNHSIVRHEEVSKEFYEDLWKALLSNKSWSGEIKNKNKNGNAYWVKSHISPIYNEKHQKIGYTAIRQDITKKKKLEEVSITDELTQVYNRRYFNMVLPKLINSAKRENEYLSFSIMDIDYFKQYNDTYGHIEGDNVLKEVANQINKILHRADDYFFRLGGEEFGILFKGLNPDEAKEFMEIIRKNIENLKIEHKHNTVSKYITASFGLVVIDSNLINNEDNIYKKADDLLYKAKNTGRNKVVY